MATVLIILPTGTYRAEEYLAAAARLGVFVVTASEKPQAMAAQMGERFVELRLKDPEAAADAIVAQARRTALDAVIAVDDEGLLAAALAAHRLGLAHSPPAAVRVTRDKAAMRRVFAEHDVPQPDFEAVTPGSPTGVAAAAGRIGPPVVVKPCSLSGSRGVIRADSPQEAGACAERISSILLDAGEPADATQLVERFVPGREVAVEGILSAGVLDIVAIFDKPDPLDGPYFEETIYVSPSELDPDAQAEIRRTTTRAVRAIGLTEGPVHAEFRLSQDGAVVIEVAARTIGGRCSKALALPGGASLEELVISRSLGASGPPARLAGPAGVLMIPIPGSGVLRQVRHLDQARAIAHITGVEITIPLGRRVRALPEGDRYLGFVFATAPDRDAVEASLRRARAMLEVVIDPDGRESPDTVVR
ncbi:MAG: ATP-grasp domain-containing protein [Acidimicrobiales bacterium]